MRAKVSPAGQAVAAAPTHHVALAADNVTGIEVGHISARLDDFAHELVPDHQRNWDGLARPIVPFVDVHVGAANAGAMYSNKNVVDPDAGLLHVLQPQTGLVSALDQCLHCRSSMVAS